MAINKKIMLLNMIISIVLFEAIFKYLLITGIENIMFAVAFAGFISSFLIKECKFRSYSKRAFFNSIIFSSFFVVIFVFDIFITHEEFSYNPDIIIILFTFLWVTYFFGSLLGIVPRGICERYRKEERV